MSSHGIDLLAGDRRDGGGELVQFLVGLLLFAEVRRQDELWIDGRDLTGDVTSRVHRLRRGKAVAHPRRGFLGEQFDVVEVGHRRHTEREGNIGPLGTEGDDPFRRAVDGDLTHRGVHLDGAACGVVLLLG